MNLAEAVAAGQEAVDGAKGNFWRGKTNVYTCEACVAQWVTINRDAGATPFLIKCRKCGAMCRSACYNNDIQPENGFPFPPHFEWYRPDPDDETVEEWQFEHISNGGLIMRMINYEK